MEDSEIDFTIVIPAFNEKERLPNFLFNLAEAVGKSGLAGEIIVVDDGSALEHRKAYLESISLINSVPVKLLDHEKNFGKGSAVKTGFRQARGLWAGFVDADGSVSPSEVIRLIKIALSSCSSLDGLLGSRFRMLGYSVIRNFSRQVCGRLFAALTGRIFRIPIYDSQCGCKFFRRNKILPILDACQDKGYLFDIELVLIGRFNKLNFLEIPICWKDMPGSKIHLIRDGLRMAAGLFILKRRLMKMGVM